MDAIDLFAGAGGFSLSAHQVGIDVLAAIELDRAASETYRANLIDELNQDIELLNGDILNISPRDLRTNLGLGEGELDLILGGPPCQGFSTHRINDAGVDDPRNKLLLRYYDFVHEFRPKAFLVENVAGLFWKKHSKYLEQFQKLAKDNGYLIHFCGTLNAKDYGVPQNRKRAFILGIRNDICSDAVVFPPPVEFFTPSSLEVRKHGFSSWRTASVVFEPLTDELIERYISDYFRLDTNLSDDQAWELLTGLESGDVVADDDPCNIHMQPTDSMRERFESLRLNGSRKDLPERFHLKCHSNGYGGHRDVYGRVFIHEPSNTMTTGCHNPSKGRFVHPWLNHGFTLRHAARLQTFPDSFIFTGTFTEKARQVGNAVPALLGYKLLQSIIEGIDFDNI